MQYQFLLFNLYKFCVRRIFYNKVPLLVDGCHLIPNCFPCCLHTVWIIPSGQKLEFTWLLKLNIYLFQYFESSKGQWTTVESVTDSFKHGQFPAFWEQKKLLDARGRSFFNNFLHFPIKQTPHFTTVSSHISSLILPWRVCFGNETLKLHK